MQSRFFCLLWVVFGCLSLAVVAQTESCPQRPFPGSEVTDSPSISSQDGVLNIDLAFRNGKDPTTGTARYCFTYKRMTEAPTLHVNPGDRVRVGLNNLVQGISSAPIHHEHRAQAGDDCSGTMTAASTNIHWHGMNIPPSCHQDEVIHTIVNPGDPPFQYDFRVPADEPPGLYWYHPHPHGLTQQQVSGGASAALIVDGIEKIKPEVAGLTERVLVFRDQLTGGGGDPDASNLTINFVPATYPATAAPSIVINPSEKQFWRVLNATGEIFLTLQVQINNQPEPLQLISMDAVPLKTDRMVKTILIPPAGRAEFIMQGPPAGALGTFVTLGEYTGIDGDPNNPQLIANLVNSSSSAERHSVIHPSVGKLGPQRFSDLAAQAPRTIRKLYFSEDLSDQNNPLFFITVAGQKPKTYDPDDPPAIVTQQGAVEDWIIENHSREVHAFHMHQLHYLLVEKNGVPVPSQNVQDTVEVDPWDGVSKTYPSVRVRMDFRYPESVGTFLYHCHILDHEDGGMMAKIEVDPAK